MIQTLHIGIRGIVMTFITSRGLTTYVYLHCSVDWSRDFLSEMGTVLCLIIGQYLCTFISFVIDTNVSSEERGTYRRQLRWKEASVADLTECKKSIEDIHWVSAVLL